MSNKQLRIYDPNTVPYFGYYYPAQTTSFGGITYLVFTTNCHYYSGTPGAVTKAQLTIVNTDGTITSNKVSDTSQIQEPLSAGTGISITGSTISCTVTAPTYGAGDNISITAGTLTDYIISSTDTTYSAGSGIDITGSTINVKNDAKTIVTNASGELETAVGG
jgi:hypothetical protein